MINMPTDGQQRQRSRITNAALEGISDQYGLINRISQSPPHRMYSMITSDSLAYGIDFRDHANCSRIESAQPGEEIQVLVYPEHEPLADSLRVKGRRSQDGALFFVEITTADGQHFFEWEYPLLKLVSQLLRPLREKTQRQPLRAQAPQERSDELRGSCEPDLFPATAGAVEATTEPHH
jgi:hypothetical protein